jgi:AcrR family transcriptional regulator
VYDVHISSRHHVASVTPPALSRETVVEAALQLVDTQGFDALTMRSLAAELGVVPMALYRHVADKRDLVDAVLDRAMARVELPAVDSPWRDSMVKLARSVRWTLLAHPGMVAPLLAEPRIGFNALSVRERSIAVLRGRGFRGDVAERATSLVLTYAIGFVALEVPRRRAGYAADGSAEPHLQAAFDLPVDLFPNTVELGTRAGMFVSDEQFEFGLTTIIAGLDDLVEPNHDDEPPLPWSCDSRTDDAPTDARHRRRGGASRAR